MYATGSHFQSVFPINHDYFIQYSLELERTYFQDETVFGIKRDVKNQTNLEENISEKKNEHPVTNKQDYIFFLRTLSN